MDKQKQFEELLKKKGILAPKGPSLVRHSEPGPYKLSFAQRRIWFLQQFDKDSGAYNDPTALRITGPLDIPLLEKTLNEIIRRHQVLRMTFPSQNGQPVQLPHQKETITIEISSLPQEAGQDIDAMARQYVNRFASHPFDLAQDLLINAALLQVAEQDYVLVVNIHHIVLDGWSKGIMLQELMDLYRAFSGGQPYPLAELPIQYTDYVFWLHEWMNGKIYASQLEYWKEKLGDTPPVLELPGDFPRPAEPTGRGSWVPFSISQGTQHGLAELAKKEGVTLFMALMAAYQILLYRYSGQEDITVGTPVAGRNRLELENLIGLFLNTLVIRCPLSGRWTARDFLQQVKKNCLEAYSNQDIPFEKLVEELNPRRSLNVTPLFQVMFQLQNAPMPPAHISGLEITPIQVDTGFAQVDLSLTIWEEEGALKGTFEYSADLFTSATIQRMTRHFLVLLEGMISHPEQEIGRLPLLTTEERQQILIEWNNTTAEYPRGSTIYELFEACAQAHPTADAVVCGDTSLTYAELHRRANALACYLQERGIGPGSLAAICMENSAELITGVTAILAAGAAYIPMDPAYPGKRLLSILHDARPGILITMGDVVHHFQGYRGEILVYNPQVERLTISCSGDSKGAGVIPDVSGKNPTTRCSPLDAACIIYTSGSTGEPKGIVIDNYNIVNLVFSFIQSYQPGPGDAILPLTSIASASFVGEILPVLTAGAKVVLAGKEHFLDMKELTALMNNYGVTILSTVPSMIARLNASTFKPSRLRLLLSGGEALSIGDIDQLWDTVTIVNGYGLTEATICSTYIIVNPDKERCKPADNPVISVGKPVMNTQVYILDRYLEAVPIGIPGEIYIAGEGLARGYLNNPELTANRFLALPMSIHQRKNRKQAMPLHKSIDHTFSKVWSLAGPPAAKLYKTGDLACWLADGNIKFLGRIDTQVQVHGHRIELAEIETHLGLFPGIRDVVVIDREIAAGDRRLVAYFVITVEPGKPRVVPGAGELREWLAKRLPDYMIPAVFEEVTEIPLTVNGKVDIAALPQPSWQRPGLVVDYKAPQSPVEKGIAAVWQEFLHLETVGIDDNFFDLGGHSLMLTQVHSRLSELYGEKKTLAIVDLFRHPTIHSLAQYIEAGAAGKEEAHIKEVYQKIQDRGEKQRRAFNREQFRGRKQSR